MNITAKVVPFSSVVGSNITLHDESGKVVCQLALLNTGPMTDDAAEWKRRQTSFAEEIAARINVSALQRNPEVTAGTALSELAGNPEGAVAGGTISDLYREAIQAEDAKLHLVEPALHPILDRDPQFEAWRDSLPETHWAKYDLSACRMGWDAARALPSPSSNDGSK